MSCHLQKLFVTDGELEDEDFLSAVEDAENQFVTPGHPSGSVVPVLPSAPHPITPHPSNSHPGNSHPSTPHPIKPPTLRPLAGQGDHPMGFPSRGSAARDEQDNSLFPAACRDMEGPEVPPGYPQKPPRKCPGKENAQEGGVPKKIRVGEELIPGSGGLQDRQSPLPSPKLVLRPSTAGACAPRDPPDMGGSRGSVPAPGAPCLRPVQTSQTGNSPSVSWTPPAQNCPWQPPRPSSGPPSSVDPPRQPPRPSSGPPRPSSGPPSSVDPPRQPPRPSSGPPRPSSGPPSSVDPPRQPPRFPNAPGPPNPPVVTNHLVQLVTAASKAPRGAPRAPQGRESRRFPGPAGILPQQQHSGKLLEEILVSAPQSPAHGAVAKPRAQALPSSPLPTEEDFGRGPWLAMKRELGLDERDPSCFLHTYSVVMVLRKAALKQLPKNKVPSMAVMIKTLSRSSAGAGAVFRDPTGEMQGTVHRLLLEQRQSELRAGAVLLLRQVGVFSPSHRNHYLNVTPNNLLRIFPPEPEGCSPRQVPAEAELIPVQPPQDVPDPEDWGQPRTSGQSSEQHPGGSSLCPPSSEPREEPLGADGCDMDDLDGLLGELPEDFFSAPAQADCG